MAREQIQNGPGGLNHLESAEIPGFSEELGVTRSGIGAGEGGTVASDPPSRVVRNGMVVPEHLDLP